MIFRRGERGNVFFTLFGAVALVGVVGAATATLMRGPMGTVISLNQKAKIESQLQIARKLIALDAAQVAGSCDPDNFIEPTPPDRTAPCNTMFTNGKGGCIPSTVGANKIDPWNTRVGYCGWNHGPLANGNGCSTDLQDGKNGMDRTVIAVISAGADRQFQTTCNDYVDDTTVLVNTPAGSDDIVMEWTFDEAQQGLGGGLWKLKSGDPNTMVPDMDLEISTDSTFASGTTATFENTASAAFGAGSMLSLSGGGMFLLPTESPAVTCDATNTGLLRRNTSGGTTEVLEICDGPGNSWVPIGGAGGVAAAGNNGELQFNASGVMGASPNLYWSGTSLGIGTSTVNNTLEVSGTADISSTLNAAGNVTFGANLDVTGNGDFNGTLDIAGATTLRGTLDMHGDISDSTGTVTVSDTFNVTGAADFDSTLLVNGAGDFDSTLNVDGGTNLRSTLNVEGNISDANSDVTIADGLNTTGAVDFDSTLNVDGAASALSYEVGGLASGEGLFSDGAGGLEFRTGGAMRMQIDSGGEVGIGSFPPAAQLDVGGGIKVGLEGASCGASLYGTIRYSSSSDKLEICAQTNNWETVGTSGGGGGGGGSKWADGTSSPDIYRATGDVGIGNNNPTYKLDVAGTFRATGDALLGGNMDVSGLARFAAGTAGAPSITFTSDSDVGFFNPAANELGFTVAGVEAMRLTPAGKLAFGSTSVSGGLEVDITGEIGAIQYCDETGAFCFDAQDVASGTAAAPGNNREIIFNSGGILGTNTNFVFTSAGRIGVGVSNPAANVEILSSAGTQGWLAVNGPGDGTNYSNITLGDATNGRAWALTHTSLFPNAFALQYFNGSWTQPLIVYPDGDIGINDLTPDDGSGSGGQNLKLDVDGPIGGTHYCDHNGLNCFTAAGVLAGGVWEDAGNLIRPTSGTVSYTSADFLFGSPQMADSGNPFHDARMFFDKSKGAFRAGRQTGTGWDDASVGIDSIALGSDAAATGVGSTALGTFAIASGDYSRAMGAGVTASGLLSMAMGYEAVAGSGTVGDGTGALALAIGLGNASTATVPRVTGTSSMGIFMGDQQGVTVSAANTMALLGGKFIIDPDTTSAANVTPATALDVIGTIRVGNGAEACAAGLAGGIRYNGGNLEYCNGTLWTALASAAGATPGAPDRGIQFNSGNAFTADANFVYTSAGRVGIGTATPNASAKLDISAGNLALTMNQYIFWNDYSTSIRTDADGAMIFSAYQGNPVQGPFIFRDSQTNTERMRIANTGRVGIGDSLPDDGSGSGGQHLLLDVEGAIGGTHFCDQNGLNCFTAAGVIAGGVWEDAGNLIRPTSGTVSYTSADFLFGSPQMADTGNPAHGSRMFFDKSKGAFRAGSVSAAQWNDANVGNYSFAIGQDNQASGTNSFAGGFASGATGDSSFAYGAYTGAYGLGSVVMGAEVYTDANYSMALGLGLAGGSPPRIAGTGTSSLAIFMGDQTGVNVTAANTMALLGGKFIIDPDTTSAANVTPATALDVIGTIRVGNGAEACAAGLAGGIRYNGGNLEYCNGTLWTALASAAGATPGAPDRGIQFNSGNAFTADANFVYTSAGRVGVGLATPSVKFHMYESSPTDGDVAIVQGWQPTLQVRGDGGGYARLALNSVGNNYWWMQNMSGTLLFTANNTNNPYAGTVMSLNASGNLGLGTGISTTAPYLVTLGGDAARTIGMERHTTADTAGNNLTILAGGATTGATNKNGGDLILSGGISEGTGDSRVLIKAYRNGAQVDFGLFNGANHSFAIGDNSSATGTDNIALGRNAAATGGFGATVLGGQNNTSSGNNATSWGGLNTARGSGSTAGGTGNTVTGEYSTGFGYEVMVGNGVGASGFGDYSMGFGLGDASTATIPRITGDSSFGIFMGDQSGVDITASNTMALLGGKFIIDPDTTSAVNVTPATALDVIGTIRVGNGAEACAAGLAGGIRYNGGNLEYCNGTVWTALASAAGATPGAPDRGIQFNSGNAFTADANFVYTSAGRVGIGTSAPTALLTVGPAFTYPSGVATIGAPGNGVTISALNLANTAAAGVGNGVGLNFTTGSPTTGFTPNASITATQADASFNSNLIFVNQVGGVVGERMRISSAGNVGIGTTSPAQTLDVNGAIGLNSRLLFTSATSFAANSSDEFIYSPSTGHINMVARGNLSFFADTNANDAATTANILFYTAQSTEAGTAKMVIQNSGNVGIGTTTPAVPLEVIGEGIFRRRDNDHFGQRVLTLDRTRADATAPQAGFGSEFTFAAEGFTNNSTKNIAVIGAFWEANQTNDTTARDSYMTFGTILDNSAVTERMRITSDGKVGIGDTTPETLLDVEGTLKIANGGETCSAGADGGMIRYNGGNLEYCNGTAWTILQSGAGTAAAPDRGIQFNSGNAFTADANFVYTSAGYVGIGTSSPTYGILDVAPSAATPSIAVGRNAATYSQIVLASGNALRSDGSGLLYLLNNTLGWHRFTNGFYETMVEIGSNRASKPTMLIYDSEATNGVTTLILRAGAGQGTSNIQEWRNNANSIMNVVDEAGNLGINTASPSERLHLSSGNFLVTGTFGAGDTLTPTGAGTRAFFYPRKAAFRAGFVSNSYWDDANIGDYSASFGSTTLASGLQSMAWGSTTRATGNSSTAWGDSSEASGIASTASGVGSVASGAYSMVFGTEVIAGSGTAADGKGDYSLALGLGNSSAASSAEYPRIEGVNSYGIFMGDQKNVNITASNVMALLGGKFIIDPDTTSAANVTPATALDVIGTIRVGNGAEACAAGLAGGIRYNSGNLEYCNGTAWTVLASGSPAAASPDRGIQFNSGGAFAAAGTFVYTSAGRLGIGTATPRHTVEVNGDILLADTQYYRMGWWGGASHSYFDMGYNPGNGNFRISKTNYGDIFNINWSTNNIGIQTITPSYVLSLGGNVARTIGMERHTTADTAGNDLTILAGGATTGATNKAGGNLILSGGISTGTGDSNVELRAYNNASQVTLLTVNGTNKSVSIGESNSISGAGSMALGDNNTAQGIRSAVLGGAYNFSIGDYSVTSGADMVASGHYSLAFGQRAWVGDGNFVNGGDGTGEGNNSVAFGLGLPSTATYPRVTGDKSFVLFMGDQQGVNVTASNTFAILGGKAIIDPDTTSAANVTPATALDVIGTIRVGNGAEACAAGLAGGIRYNTGNLEYCNGSAWTVLASGSGSAAAPDRGIQFNSGGAFAAASTFVYTSAGRVGIGTATPVSPLQVMGNVTVGAGGAQYAVQSAGQLHILSNSGYAGSFYDLWLETRGASGAIRMFTNNTNERLSILANGNVGIGTTTPEATLEVAGSLCISGSASDNCGTINNGQLKIKRNVVANAFDLAERYPAAEDIEPGTIVGLDPAKPLYVRAAAAGADTGVIGIVSTDPGLVLGWEDNEIFTGAPHVSLVALSGRVPLKVTGEGGAINIGDRVALSATVAGHGTKAGDDTGTVVGIALDSFTPADAAARGTINVFVKTRDMIVEKDLREKLSALQAENDKIEAALNEVVDDVKGLKAHTGYGIGRAGFGPGLLAGMVVMFGASLLVVFVSRRRKG